MRVLCQDQKAMEAMHAAGPVNTYYPPPRTAMVEVIKELINQKEHAYIYMENEDFSVKLSKRSTERERWAETSRPVSFLVQQGPIGGLTML